MTCTLERGTVILSGSNRLHRISFCDGENMSLQRRWRRFCIAGIACLTAVSIQFAAAAEYQWSVPLTPVDTLFKRPNPRAFLWIPTNCNQVRAVIVGQHNMLEEDILEHPDFRKAMTDLGVAIVWITPIMDAPFDPGKSGDRFNAMMKSLAAESGYRELEFAPVAPIGHSACASYPWNFAAWAPRRTLAILSIHGDAPQTPLAGFGHQDVHWPDGAIDGVPGLMVVGEYEWIDARLAPATVYKLAHPKTPIAVLAEPGVGHFAACDELIEFLAMFVRKCVEQRLPPLADTPLHKPPQLRPINPSAGWLVQRWTPGQARTVPAGPFDHYAGDAVDAFWAFDQEMAADTQNYRADQVGKLPQLIGFYQDGRLVPAVPDHPMVHLKFLPNQDCETFTLQAKFLDRVTSMGGDKDGPGKNNHVRWTGMSAGSSIGHATGGGPIRFQRIEGPVEQIGPSTFRMSLYRGYSNGDPIWLCATHPGDDQYKSAVQQAVMPVPRNDAGAEQTINFPTIPDQSQTAGFMKLSATSSSGLTVHFFVREGPAEVDGDTLRFLPIPPRARLPVKVTVVAWQWGRSIEPLVRTADPVEQTFLIGRTDSASK